MYRNTGKEDIHYPLNFDDDGELSKDDWATTTFGGWSEKIDFPVCHSLYCLYDHTECYSLQDIVRIDDFDSEIEVKFDMGV